VYNIHTYVHTDHLHRYCKWSNIARPHIRRIHISTKKNQTWSDSCIFDPLSLFRVGLSIFLDWFQLGSEFHRFLFVFFLALPHSFLCYPLNFGVFVFTKRKIIRKCMTSKQNKRIVEKKTPKSKTLTENFVSEPQSEECYLNRNHCATLSKK